MRRNGLGSMLSQLRPSYCCSVIDNSLVLLTYSFFQCVFVWGNEMSVLSSVIVPATAKHTASVSKFPCVFYFRVYC